MEECVEIWNEKNIWSNIEEKKKIYVESKGIDEFKQSVEDYLEKIDDPNSNGAIFMGVVRGKVSECMNFSDKYGRGVMMVGLPLRRWGDPKIKVRDKYTGWEWLRYYLDAIRYVEQAIGRVIRHRNDYGAIFLCDYRFDQYKNNFSSWIQEHLSNEDSQKTIQSIQSDVAAFFKNCRKNYESEAAKTDDSEYEDVSISSKPIGKYNIRTNI